MWGSDNWWNKIFEYSILANVLFIPLPKAVSRYKRISISSICFSVTIGRDITVTIIYIMCTNTHNSKGFQKMVWRKIHFNHVTISTISIKPLYFPINFVHLPYYFDLATFGYWSHELGSKLLDPFHFTIAKHHKTATVSVFPAKEFPHWRAWYVGTRQPVFCTEEAGKGIAEVFALRVINLTVKIGLIRSRLGSRWDLM